MGLSNDIITKEDIKCLKCGKSLRYDTKHPLYEGKIIFQSKDLHDRMHKWEIGDKITIEGGGLKFVAEGNTTWKGVHGCPHCRAFFECDIIIKKGIITAIKNLREYKY